MNVKDILAAAKTKIAIAATAVVARVRGEPQLLVSFAIGVAVTVVINKIF